MTISFADAAVGFAKQIGPEGQNQNDGDIDDLANKCLLLIRAGHGLISSAGRQAWMPHGPQIGKESFSRERAEAASASAWDHDEAISRHFMR